MDLELAGKRALVTGGSGGIGRAIASCLATEAVAVAVTARDAARARDTAEQIARETGQTIVGFAVDTGKEDSVNQLKAAVIAEFGHIDILVNAAATPAMPGLGGSLFATPDHWVASEVDVKVLGYLRTAQAFAPAMIEAGWGRIINVGGLGARLTGSIAGTIRNVSVAALSKNLADELGPAGINVHVLHPGPTRTGSVLANIAAQAQQRGVDPEAVEAELGEAMSIRRLVTPEEVAAVATFLASPRSAAMTGEAVVCGGGQRGRVYY